MQLSDRYGLGVKSTSNRRGSGFTLAELIVASTIMALVMLGVYTSLSVSVRVWRGGEENTRVYEDARMVTSLIEAELRGVPQSALHLFNGDEKSLEFYTLARPLWVEDGDSLRILRVRYRLSGRRNSKGGRTLVREEAIVKSSLPTATKVNGRVDTHRIKLGRKRSFELCDGVEALEFRYFWERPYRLVRGQAPPDLFPIIEDEVQDAFPQGVEVSLTLTSGADEGATSHRFESFVVSRAKTSVVPKDVLRRAGLAY